MTKNLERQKKEYREEQIGKCLFAISQYNLSLRTLIPNLKFLSDCGDIFDEKSGEKEKRTNVGKNKRRRPILNPTMQLVVVNLYTKFEVSILNGCGDISLTNNLERKKKDKYREEQIGEGPFAIPRYNLSL